jgi:CPA1 family monovalent cation:H+ antiporter
MTPAQTAAVFLALTALVGWINAKTARAPQSVALLCAGVLAAGLLFAAQTLIGPFWGFNSVRDEIARLDFPATVLGYLLAFLLFSGGMQVDLGEFRRRRLAIWSLATVGVLVSTALVGLGAWGAARLAGLDLPLAWALVFGALISPTDPVAVLANVKSGDLSRALGAILQGEALFNDGVGLVAFTAALAFLSSGSAPNPLEAGWTILVEVGGGLALGAAGGWLVAGLMRSVDNYVVELTLTLAAATGVYVLAQALHVSGPIAASAAGLVVGSYGIREGGRPGSSIHAFWHAVDEVLNGLLFLLLGLQIFVVPFNPREVAVWAVAIPLVVASRFLVVLPWGAYFHFQHRERGASLLLAWGGLRGAISLALALSLPVGEPKSLVLATTFAVVIFSVVVQGQTFGALAKRLKAWNLPADADGDSRAAG